MAKTKHNIVTRALRMIEVVGVGEVPDADDYAHAVEMLETEYARANREQSLALSIDLDATPDELFEPLAMLVASKVAMVYRKQGPRYSSAIAAMRAYALPDDRTDSRDLDDDGTVSTAEAAAGERAAYY